MCAKNTPPIPNLRRWGSDRPEVGWGRCPCGAPIVYYPAILVCTRTGNIPANCVHEANGDPHARMIGMVWLEELEEATRRARQEYALALAGRTYTADPQALEAFWEGLDEAMED